MNDFEQCISEWADRVAECDKTITQLQATLTARDSEIEKLKLMQKHSIADECEAEQHLIDAGIPDYEPGKDGEYRGLLTQIDVCIKERDHLKATLAKREARIQELEGEA